MRAAPPPGGMPASGHNLLLRFTTPGDPATALSVHRESVRQPGAGEVRLEMLAAPINPADLNIVQGVYGRRPATSSASGAAVGSSPAGMEGVGIVVESGTPKISVGDRVIVLSGIGTWARSLTLPATDVCRAPADLPAEQAAMLKVNPLTALRLLHDFVPLPSGGWIVQNAANSGVGRCVIQLAARAGWRTANLVRRAAERAPELAALGADLVLEDGDPRNAEAVLDLTGGVRPTLALNAVGGESGSALLRFLAPGGCLVTYGGMSRRSLKVSTSQLVFDDLRLRGFWLSRWLDSTPRDKVQTDLDRLAREAVEGRLVQAIDSRYPLEAFPAAIGRAQEEFRRGRVLFDLRATDG
jgi:trans-2-enoyl-CoA reductase